jgi:H-type small acid-soluble spore protein
MNSTRVNEILQSEQTIGVNYQGLPVWINSLNGNEATVHRVGQHNEKFQVPVNQLQEQNDVEVGG